MLEIGSADPVAFSAKLLHKVATDETAGATNECHFHGLRTFVEEQRSAVAVLKLSPWEGMLTRIAALDEIGMPSDPRPELR
jgi:hypothetical protein